MRTNFNRPDLDPVLTQVIGDWVTLTWTRPRYIAQQHLVTHVPILAAPRIASKRNRFVTVF